MRCFLHVMTILTPILSKSAPIWQRTFLVKQFRIASICWILSDRNSPAKRSFLSDIHLSWVRVSHISNQSEHGICLCQVIDLSLTDKCERAFNHLILPACGIRGAHLFSHERTLVIPPESRPHLRHPDSISSAFRSVSFVSNVSALSFLFGFARVWKRYAVEASLRDLCPSWLR